MFPTLPGKDQLNRIETEQKPPFFYNWLRLKYRKASSIGLAGKS
jgi:hypothetical protein